MNQHDSLLDTVAVYALGALPPQEAEAVRQHLATCAECREEYRLLRPAVNAIGVSAEACPDAASAADAVAPPGPLLKKRIMQQIRPNVAQMRAVRPIVWPAYAVAAACLIVALVSGIVNTTLNAQLRESQAKVAQLNAHASAAARELARQRTELADLIAPDSQRYPVASATASGEVVKHGQRLYIAMNALPPPPKGKVYQAWTLRAGATKMSPSVTFVPNSSGVAVVPVPTNAASVVAVAVSVEPDGGSKQPTSKPTFVLKLS
jgi:Anti-sigma-K factor rskA/Putative zinc-finger